MSNEKYRPSNGTEGDIFHSERCEHCAYFCDENEEYCEIINLTMIYKIDDKNYPSEWTYDDEGDPCCTQYLHNSEMLPQRCTRTQDMFGG